MPYYRNSMRLLPAEGLQDDEAVRLREMLSLFPAYGVPADVVTLDLGLGRGLTYYTGIVFEWVASDGTHIGGGGRYDDLATRIGARHRFPPSVSLCKSSACFVRCPNSLRRQRPRWSWCARERVRRTLPRGSRHASAR